MMTTSRRPTDPLAAAQAAFKPIKKPQPATKSPTLPNARELVSLRIDRNVLDYFQKSGPGWQDRINEALQEITRQGSTDNPGKLPDELDSSNDG